MRKIAIFVALVFLLMLGATPALADGIPALPHAFYGSVTVNGDPAADGTQVSATVDSGDILATQNPVTTVGGSYGVDSPRLLVQGDITPGATITFYVKDVEVEGVTATFEAGGGPTRVDLGVTISRPGGGGGGGGRRDTDPPRISDIGLCYEEVTETTANICWKTNEKSSSQVEYWASPSEFSTLDETLVTEHHVELTGLTPSTTYHYRTMSEDAAGNLAISDVQTFTTKGKAPEEVPPPPPEEVTPPPPEEIPPPPPEEVPPVKAPINWPLIGGIIAAVVVVGLLIFFLVRRRSPRY